MRHGIREMGVIALILALALQTTAPAVVVEAPQRETIEIGRTITFTVRVEMGDVSPDAEASLQPLELTNLRIVNVEKGAQLIAGNSSRTASRWFRFTLEPLAAGAAAVGAVRAQITLPGEEQPRLLEAEGFSLQAFEPFDWNKLPAWVPWTIGGVILGLVWVFFGRFVTRRVRRLAPDEDAEDRRHVEEQLNHKLRSGDYRGAVDAAYGMLLAVFDESGRDFKSAAAGDNELRAAARLGEEVRYAGYRPDRGEAAFIVRLARAAFAKPSESEKEIKAEGR